MGCSTVMLNFTGSVQILSLYGRGTKGEGETELVPTGRSLDRRPLSLTLSPITRNGGRELERGGVGVFFFLTDEVFFSLPDWEGVRGWVAVLSC